MIKRVFTIFILTLILLFNCPVYSLDMSSKTIDKYTKKISNKFTRTYCNTSKFGISYEGALAFAIGETNKEFKNNKLNKLVDYSLLKKSIIYDLQNNCQIYDFDISSLENLKLNYINENCKILIYFLPIQSLGFSIIHSKTPLASRFLDA